VGGRNQKKKYKETPRGLSRGPDDGEEKKPAWLLEGERLNVMKVKKKVLALSNGVAIGGRRAREEVLGGGKSAAVVWVVGGVCIEGGKGDCAGGWAWRRTRVRFFRVV